MEEIILEYLNADLIVVAVVTYCVGVMLKQFNCNGKLLLITNLVVSIGLTTAFLMQYEIVSWWAFAFADVTQAILACALGTYFYEVLKKVGINPPKIGGEDDE